MDPLTHTAAGLFLSRAGLNRWTPLATPILILAANAPDIDIVTLAGGPLQYLHYHRHLTHSIIAMPVMALLPVLLVRALGRRPVNWLWAWLAAMVAVASHLLLDWTNAYGIRLLLPFSPRWLRLDWTHVVDLWIWAVFLLCLAAPFLGSLVGSEISSGAGRGRGAHGRGFAWLALAFLLLYDCGRGVLHARALATLESRLYQGVEPTGVEALPDAANPLHWRGVVETPEFFAVSDFSLADDFDPTRAAILHRPEPDPAMAAARRAGAFRQFLTFCPSPLWRVSPAADLEGGKQVEAIDLRFGGPMAPGLMARARVDAAGRVVDAALDWRLPPPR